MSTIKTTNNEDEDDESLSFDAASKSIVDEENQAVMERMTSEEDDREAAEFETNKSEYDNMRERIRARASDLNIEKSVATEEAVKAAEARAKARVAEAAANVDEPTLDLGVLENSPFGGKEPEEELTDEEMAEADQVGQLSVFQQVMAEMKETSFPGPLDVLKTVFFMSIIFVVTAAIIWKTDAIIRSSYTEWGLIPPKNSFDPGDLPMPEGFEADLDPSAFLDSSKY